MTLSPLDTAPPLRARPDAWRAWLATLTPGARADLAADAEDALAGVSDALRARYRALLVTVPAPVVHAVIVRAVEAWERRRCESERRRGVRCPGCLARVGDPHYLSCTAPRHYRDDQGLMRRPVVPPRRWRDCGPDVWDCVGRTDPPDAAGETEIR